MDSRAAGRWALSLTALITGLYGVVWAIAVKTDGHITSGDWVLLGYFVFVICACLLGMRGLEAVAKRPCPRCGVDVKKGIVKCPSCGFDFGTLLPQQPPPV